jgi:8-oxo-dGTP pyrophosphatase MutT (NUDIX family)
MFTPQKTETAVSQSVPGAGHVDTVATVAAEQKRGGQQRIPRPADFRIAGPPPWAGLDDGARHLPLAEVRRRLMQSPPGAEAVSLVPGSVPSAVLAPLVELGGETHVLFIKRPETMSTHKGEIAFPGGKSDPVVDADILATALREAREEIGLDPGAVEIVARLSGVATAASRFTITPFVGFLSRPPELVRNPAEVVRVLEVPLAELLDAAIFHEERWDGFQHDMAVFFFDLVDETLWGATARILTDLLTRLVTAPH